MKYIILESKDRIEKNTKISKNYKRKVGNIKNW